MLYIHRLFLLDLKFVSSFKSRGGGDRLSLVPLIMRTDFLPIHQILRTDLWLLTGNQKFQATKKALPGTNLKELF
jgi:hypothetical protein